VVPASTNKDYNIKRYTKSHIKISSVAIFHKSNILYYFCISVTNDLFAINIIIPIIMYRLNIITITFLQFLKYLHETKSLQIIPTYNYLFKKMNISRNYH
jgi:hypothetical protein